MGEKKVVARTLCKRESHEDDALEWKSGRSIPRVECINLITEDTGCPIITALKRITEDPVGASQS